MAGWLCATLRGFTWSVAGILILSCRLSFTVRSVRRIGDNVLMRFIGFVWMKSGGGVRFEGECYRELRRTGKQPDVVA
jgi:hypothetical protein